MDPRFLFLQVMIESFKVLSGYKSCEMLLAPVHHAFEHNELEQVEHTTGNLETKGMEAVFRSQFPMFQREPWSRNGLQLSWTGRSLLVAGLRHHHSYGYINFGIMFLVFIVSLSSYLFLL